MNSAANIHIVLGLRDHESRALAQFVKRVARSAMRECAVDEAECHQIRAAIDKLQRALAEARHAPR